jgi:predicted RNA-binding protein
MCQSSVYAVTGETEELLLEEVVALAVEGEWVMVRSLFGEPLHVRARVRQIDLTRNRIVLERIPDAA